MEKKLLLILALCLCLPAAEAAGRGSIFWHPDSIFPIQTYLDLNERQVQVDTGSAAPVVWVRIRNMEDRPLTCKATFRNGPELPRVRRATLHTDESVILSARVWRSVIKMRVWVNCRDKQPAEQEGQVLPFTSQDL